MIGFRGSTTNSAFSPWIINLYHSPLWMLMHPESNPRGLTADTRLILALDVTDKEHAVEIVREVKDHIDAVKINYPLILACGPSMVNELSCIRPVICDFKIADIPNTCRLITENAFERGASAVIAHAFSGQDSLETIRGIADKHNGMVFSVVEMSHPGALASYDGITDRMIDISISAGILGYIAPGTRPDKIRHIRKRVEEKTGNSPLILSPGIGAQGGDGKKAIDSGADFIIVGRAIYQAENPGSVAKQIVESL